MLGAVSDRLTAPLGAVLAGGAGRRLGGLKPTTALAGRPLAAWVADGLRAVAAQVVILAKPATLLPPLPGVEVWREPARPLHPLAGIAWALERSAGREVVVCAVDLPFAAAAIRAVTRAAAAAAAPGLVIAAGQPLLGVYRPAVGDALRDAAERGAPVIATIRELGAIEVDVPDPGLTLANINTPADLVWAEAMAGDAGV